jgi:hypothetical protein
MESKEEESNEGEDIGKVRSLSGDSADSASVSPPQGSFIGASLSSEDELVLKIEVEDYLQLKSSRVVTIVFQQRVGKLDLNVNSQCYVVHSTPPNKLSSSSQKEGQ